MKKIYLLSLICLMNIVAFAQTQTTTIWAQDGIPLTYVTGTSDGTTRSDDDIVATGTGTGATDSRGYAVFDLSGIPADATISSVDVGFYVMSVTGSGGLTNADIRLYDINTSTGSTTLGDMALLTSAATLYTEMAASGFFTRDLGLNSTATWGVGAGNKTDNITSAFRGLIKGNFGGKISLVWTGGNGRTYRIKGHTGSTTSTTTPNHAPYITIRWCPKPHIAGVSLNPNPVCPNATFTLTATHPSGTITSSTGGTDYTWLAPAGSPIAATSPTTTATASATSAGVYTLIVTNNCAGSTTNSDTMITASLSLLPSPGGISGPTALCMGDVATLSDVSGATTTTWSGSTGIASIGATTGIVTPTAAGPITFRLTEPSTGCWVSHNMVVNNAPGTIGAIVSTMCEKVTITLTQSSTAGTWSSANSLIGSVASTGAVTGIVGGAAISAGVVDISYTVPGCPPAVHTVTVKPIPADFTFASLICQGGSVTISDATKGGTWTSTNPGVANITYVGADTILNGVSTGNTYMDSTRIIYTTPNGCSTQFSFSVSPQPSIIGDSVVCQNASISVSTPLPISGSWTSGNPGIASITATGGVITGLLAGITQVTYTATYGNCTQGKQVTVNPVPVPITGTPRVCEHDITSLTDADPGGFWSSNNTLLATVGSATGDVYGISSGSVIISYTFFITGCYTTTVIPVLAAPVALIGASGPTTFCSGGSVILNGPGGPGYTYQWFRNGAPISGATNISFTASTTDSFTVSVRNANACYDLSAPTFVNAAIAPNVTAGGATSFCVGGGVSLTVNTSGAAGTMFYQWQKNGVDLPSATAINYYANTTGVYTCRVSITGASGVCVVLSDPQNVFVNPAPHPVITKVGGTYNTAVLSSYVSYQWFRNTVAIPGATTPIIIPTFNGAYQVRVTDTSGCTGYSEALNHYLVGVNQVSMEGIHIYPNPATSVIHIDAPVNVKAVVTGLEGRTLIEKASVTDLDISSLPGGMYMIMLYNDKGDRIAVEKLIKE